MKKCVKIGLIIIIVLVFVLLTDFICVFLIKRPLLARKDGGKYVGLFYDVYICDNINIPLIKVKGNKYSCEVTIKEKYIKNITDKTKTNEIVCNQAIEEFYEDENYKYSYSCMKSNLVIVEYSDGTEETAKEALESGNIKINDLDRFGIVYYSFEK